MMPAHSLEANEYDMLNAICDAYEAVIGVRPEIEASHKPKFRVVHYTVRAYGDEETVEVSYMMVRMFGVMYARQRICSGFDQLLRRHGQAS